MSPQYDFLLNKYVENAIYDMHPNIFSFQHKRHHQVAQGITWSNRWWLVAAHKIGVKDDCLEIEVRSARSGVEPIDFQHVLHGPSVLLVPIVIRYRVSFSSALFTQLQLWHLRWLVQYTGEQHSQLQVVFHFTSHGRNAGIVRTRPNTPLLISVYFEQTLVLAMVDTHRISMNYDTFYSGRPA